MVSDSAGFKIMHWNPQRGVTCSPGALILIMVTCLTELRGKQSGLDISFDIGWNIYNITLRTRNDEFRKKDNCSTVASMHTVELPPP